MKIMTPHGEIRKVAATGDDENHAIISMVEFLLREGAIAKKKIGGTNFYELKVVMPLEEEIR